MTHIVIDTNKIFSMLILENSSVREKFLGSEHRFYAPNYIFVEIFEKKINL